MSNDFVFDDPGPSETPRRPSPNRPKPAGVPAWVYIIGGVCLLASVGVGIWFLLPAKKDPPRGSQDPTREVVKLNAFDYYQEYKADEAGTKKKYLGKILEVEGIVMSADSVNIAGEPQVVLQGSPDRQAIAMVQCMFPERDEAVVTELAEGQTVTIRGVIKSDTFGFGAPLLECTLVSAAPSPAVRITAQELTREFAADKEATEKKYDEKPMILEGMVLSVAKNDFDYTFVLAGHDESTVEIAFGHAGMDNIKKQLAAVQLGQTIRIKGEAGFGLPPKSITLYKAILLKGTASSAPPPMASTPVPPVTKTSPSPTAKVPLDAAIAALEKAGGKVEKDDDGSVIEVTFADGMATDQSLELLAPFTRLEILDLTGAKITNDGLKALSGFRYLHKLWLQNCDISDEALLHLAGLTRLDDLSLYGTQVTGTGLKHLDKLRNLTTLDLANSQMTDEGMKHLAPFNQLRRFRIGSTQVTDDGLKGLSSLAKLQSLDLSDLRITDKGLEALAPLINLEDLDLARTDVAGEGLEQLTLALDLRRLILIGSKVTDDGLKHIAPLMGLKSLYLSDTAVTGSGLKSLTSLTNLEELILGGAKVTDEGLKNVAGLTSLKSLFLGNTEISDAGLKHLVGLTGLESLNLRETKVTKAGVEVLKKALPKCEIYALD